MTPNSSLKGSLLQRIVRHYEDYIIDVIERSLANPCHVELLGDVIGCANGVPRHVDAADIFDPWSAFYVVHNDACVVWGHGGVRLCPREGQRFSLNINRQHGVQAKEHRNQVFAAIIADGKTKHEATAKLTAMLKAAQ